MSTEIERIKDQMQKIFYSDAWHGGSVMEFLSEISAKEAASHLLKGAAHGDLEEGGQVCP
jgi:hypothetical protein